VKIGIITFHRVINYGGVLQAYALQQAMQSLTNNDEIEIVDYINPHFEQQYAPFSVSMLRHPKSLLMKLSLAKYKKQRNQKFSYFVCNNLKLGGNRISRKELPAACAKYSKLVTGSDQVWNPQCTGEDFTYFLDIDCAAEKFSYAASFAVEKLDTKYDKRVKKCLEQFVKISVREHSGAEIVRELVDKQAVILPDPTLLLEATDWEKLEIKPGNIPDKYILIVQMGGEIDDLYRQARKVHANLPIVYINLAQKPVEGLVNICVASPEEWLYLLHHAECVVTNSFHGCVFSVLFHKNFYYELTKGKNSNSRLVTLAKTLGLEDRNVTVLSENNVQKAIDYVKVEEELNKLRQSGYQYLKDIIGES